MTKRPDGMAPLGDYRTWTDNTGRYHWVALFTGVDGHTVKFRKMYGTDIEMPISRLSEKDRKWIRRELNKPPPQEIPDMTERPVAAKEMVVPDMTERPVAAKQKGNPELPRMTQRPDAARETKMVTLFTIYNKETSDYPGVMVIRRWEVSATVKEGRGQPIMTPKEIVGTGDTLEEMRRLVPDGCVNLGRFAQEDPNIVESWMKQ